MQQTIHEDCTELTTFVCEHLSVCLHNPFSWDAVCSIHPFRKHEKDQLFLGSLLYLFFWEGCASIPFLYVSSLADRIKYSEVPKYSKQYFHDQESGIKANICNFSVFEAVTDLCQACSLSRLSTLFL